MKLFFVYFILLTNVSMLLARKKDKIYRQGRVIALGSGKIDLRGNLRKYFYLITSLNDLKDNVACSPVSALLPLGKLALGAVNSSLVEMLDAIGIAKKEEIRQHFKPLIAEMRYLPGAKLDVASKIYLSWEVKLNKDFRNTARDIFKYSVDQVDFSTPSVTVDKINNWVSLQTHGTIKEIVQEGEITPASSVVIVNAVYFKGKWEEPFKKAREATFYSSYGAVNVSMMARTAAYNYTSSEALKARIIKVPYSGGKSYFLIVLPNTKNGLPGLLKLLKTKPGLIDAAMTKLIWTNLSLKLPVFKVESTLNLKDAYNEIGVRKIFTPEAGLSELVEDAEVVVSSVTQKTFIEVNEEGTTASAATSGSMMKLSLHIDIVCDVPFLFFIITENQQLMAGTLKAPQY